jgi:hypothetical protein
MTVKFENNWDKMREVIGLAAKFLPESEVKNAEHYLAHDEIEIAFQELCGSICERNLMISQLLKTKLLALYNDLEGDSEDFWQEIGLKNHILNMKIEGT